LTNAKEGVEKVKKIISLFVIMLKTEKFFDCKMIKMLILVLLPNNSW
jgi:hypothetical protein